MVTVNGKTYHGSSVSIINGVVTVDGKVVDGEPVSGVLEIRVEGDLAALTTDASVVVNGYVAGDVKAGGSINCGTVGGQVEAGGSVVCRDVGGSVTAGGSVVSRKRN